MNTLSRIGQNPMVPATAIWLLSAMFGLVPPFSRDALNDHMVLPLLWDQHGLFWRDTALAFTAYPPLADIPYILFAGHSWDWLASIVHAFGSLVTLLFLNRAMTNLDVDSKARLLVLLSWSITPAVISLTTWCYVDLWLCACAAAAMERLTRSEWQNRDAILFGLFLGLALLIKYNALPLALGLMFGLLWRWGKTPTASIRHGALASFILVMVSGWWYAWNWIELGSPLYPLGSGDGGLSWLQLRTFAYHELPFWAAMAPLRQFFWGEVNNPLMFDGMLHPLWLAWLFVPLVWKKNKRAGALLITALIYVIFALTTSVRARYWLPGMVMLLPVTGLALMHLRSIGWKLIAGCSFIPAVISCLIYLNSIQPWLFWFEGRDAYLKLHIPDYELQHWAASNLPEEASVYLLWTGGRAYYLNRPYSFDFGKEGDSLRQTIVHNTQPKQGYIIMQRNLADRTLGKDLGAKWQSFIINNSCLIGSQNVFELRSMKPCK